MYAIIATGGKQYKVAEGDVIRVEKLGVEAGETVTFDNVIAVSNDGLKAGEDVKDASVTATVVENGKARKVIVSRKDINASAADFLEEPIVVARASGTCVTPKEMKRK